MNNKPLTLAAYQEAAVSADRSRDDTLNVPLLGLFGETGGLLSVAKKKHRDRASFFGYGPAVIEELGDVLWYFTVTAARAGLNLSDIGANLGSSISEWSTGTAALQFREIQEQPNVNPPDNCSGSLCHNRPLGSALQCDAAKKLRGIIKVQVIR